MKERKPEERDVKVRVNGEAITVKIIDEEKFWPGVGRAPNHDKVFLDYKKEEKQKIPQS